MNCFEIIDNIDTNAIIILTELFLVSQQNEHRHELILSIETKVMETSNENFLINEGLELQYYRFPNHDLNKDRRHCLLLFKVYVLILITRF